MADDVVNIKNGPTLDLTFVVGHDESGRGGRKSVADLLNFGAVGGIPGPVIAQGKIVYGNNQGGEYSPVSYNEDPTAFALVMRDFNGNFSVHDPTSAAHPASMQWTQAQVTAFANTVGQIGGPAGPLDGNGHIPGEQVPPLPRELGGEVADQTAMLALNVSAPAECIRTDFNPPHIFYLGADPATDINNWHDLGPLSAGAGNPTSTVGPTATNGIAGTYMRSDAAPAIDLTAAYDWTGEHTFGHNVAVNGVIACLTDINANRDITAVRYLSTGGALFLGDPDVAPAPDVANKDSAIYRGGTDNNSVLMKWDDGTIDTIHVKGGSSGGGTGTTYTPAVTAGAGAASAGPDGLWFYTQVGSIVTVSGTLGITQNATDGLVTISLPVAKTVSQTTDIVGSAIGYDNNNSLADARAVVYGDINPGENRATLFFTAPNTNSRQYAVDFRYAVS